MFLVLFCRDILMKVFNRIEYVAHLVLFSSLRQLSSSDNWTHTCQNPTIILISLYRPLSKFWHVCGLVPIHILGLTNEK